MQTKLSPSDGPCYLSGPMSGMPEHNLPAFHWYAKQLRQRGWTIVNPAEINGLDAVEKGLPYEQCLKNDIRAMMDCVGIILMPGWERSNGAQLEQYIAFKLKMKVAYAEALV
jgi:hypothetical protein